MAAQAFVTAARLRRLDAALDHVILMQKGNGAQEQATIVKSLIQNREYMDPVVRIAMSSPERVVEGLISLAGDNMLKE